MAHDITLTQLVVNNLHHMLESTSWYGGNAKYYYSAGKLVDEVLPAFVPGLPDWGLPDDTGARDKELTFQITERQRETLKTCVDFYFRSSKLPAIKPYRQLLSAVGLSPEDGD